MTLISAMRSPGVVLTLIIIGVFTVPVRAEFETPVALRGATIVTGAGPIYENGVILIEHGRITAVGEDVMIPLHARIDEMEGMIIYPGFIDAQSHLGIPDEKRSESQRKRLEDESPDPREGPLVETRFANRKGIRSHWRAYDLYQPDEKKLKAHRALGFTAALIAPRDGILSGRSELIDLSGLPLRRSVLADDVAMHGSFSTGEDGAYPRTLLGVFAVFRQVMLDAQWQNKLVKFAERHPADAPRIPVDPAIDALEPLLRGKQRIVFEANRERDIHRAIDLAGEFGLRVVISGGKEAWKVADRLAEERIPVILTIKFDEEPEYGKKKKDRKKPGVDDPKAEEEPEIKPTTPQEEPEETEESEAVAEGPEADKDKIYEPLRLRKERRRLWHEQVDNALRLREAGVHFTFRTRDFDDPKAFIKNLRRMMERGLSEQVVVNALTDGAARLLAPEAPLGQITPGRLANLTILDGRLDSEESRFQYVYIGGEKFELIEGDKKDQDKKKDEEKKEEATSAEEGDEVDEDDKGPTYAVEIEADRKPITQTGGSVLVRNATIIPVTAPTLTNASILIEDGKITAMGPDITAPDGVTVIDGTDRFVIPGFVDAHSHLGLDAVNESPLAISAEVRIADVVNPDHVGLFRAVAGGTTTHHIMHGSANPIGGQCAVAKIKYGQRAREMLLADVPPLIKFATGENVTQANSCHARGNRFPVTRMGVESVYRSAMEAGKAYIDAWGSYEAATAEGRDVLIPRRDLRLEALADVFRGDLTIHAHCYRSEEILRLLGVAEEFGFRIGTLHHVLEGYRIAPEIARHGCGASTFASDWAYKVEAYQAIPHNAAFMEKRGICTTVNSDSANTIRYLGQEAAKSLRWGGLPPEEAIKLVTINAARQLQVADRVGSLEVGKDGDLAIFSGHPLNTFSKCILTIIEGEVYFEDDDTEPVEPCATVQLAAEVDRSIPRSPHAAYAIVGATVHPISGDPIEDGTVVIVNDQIQAVGPGIPVPPGAGVIEGEGLHVYPGLIDAGSRLGLAEIGSLASTRDYREIGSFNPQLTAIAAFHPHSEMIEIARAAGITSTLIKPDGNPIAGRSAVVQLDGWTAAEMTIDPAFSLHMSVPSLPVHLPEDKKRRKKMEEDHKESMKKLNEFFDRARHYAKVIALANEDADIQHEIDPALAAMAPYVGGEEPVVFSAGSYKHILDTIGFAEKQNIQPIIFGGEQAWKLAETLAEKRIPVILSSPLSYPAGWFEPWDSVYRCAAVLHEAGVPFCFASGSYSSVYDLTLQVGMAVAHGLPRAAAERALTLGAAEILGLDDRLGSLEAGKRADLIVVTDTPLQTSSVVTHAFIAGRPLDLSNMHTRNHATFEARPKPNLPPAPELRGLDSLTTTP